MRAVALADEMVRCVCDFIFRDRSATDSPDKICGHNSSQVSRTMVRPARSSRMLQKSPRELIRR